jgi:hypothetical protein
VPKSAKDQGRSTPFSAWPTLKLMILRKNRPLMPGYLLAT